MRVVAIAVAGLTLWSVSHTQATPNQARSIDATAAAITDVSAAKRHKKHAGKQTRINRDDQFLAIRSQTHQAERARIREAMLGVVREQVLPAYSKFAKFVREEYARALR